MKERSYWHRILRRYRSSPIGVIGAVIVIFFILIALWAPFLASSKPLWVVFNGKLFFPLFRYLFSCAFFTSPLDIFYNILGAALPLLTGSLFLPKKVRSVCSITIVIMACALFWCALFVHTFEPATSPEKNEKKLEAIVLIQEEARSNALVRKRYPLPSWRFELTYMNDYAQLNLVVGTINKERTYRKIERLLHGTIPYTAYSVEQERFQSQKQRLLDAIAQGKQEYMTRLAEEEELRKDPECNTELLLKITEQNIAFETLENRHNFLQEKEEWIQRQQQNISYMVMPFIRPYHWEDDVGGTRDQNVQLPFIEFTRINRADLTAALIFGTRISLFVGIATSALCLIIGIPLGLVSGFYGGKIDVILSRLMEIWQSMPVFFMLLLVVTVLQTKSIFLVIVVLAIFGWTSSFRFVRAETFRQREMMYVEACRALGFPDRKILFGHILINSLVAVVALLPFDVMYAILREAGLAFLGLGEERSCSWGVLMDEGRAVFGAESILIWPPAIVLTVLLIGIAFIGEALQKAIDPKSELISNV